MAAHIKKRIPHPHSLQQGMHNKRLVDNKPADANRLGENKVAEVRVRTTIFVVRDIGASVRSTEAIACGNVRGCAALRAVTPHALNGLGCAAVAAQHPSASSCCERQLVHPA